MIKNLTLTLLVLFFSLFFADFAISYSASPPVSKTNAPGESNCTNYCHSGTLNGGNGSVFVTFPDSVYKPDSTYTLTATVDDANKKRFGFQLTSLDGAAKMSGSFTITNATNTAAQSGMVQGSNRDYVNHKNATGNNSWTFDWTAPSVGTGPINFWIAGNAADSGLTNSKDVIYANQLIWEEYTAPQAGVVEIAGATEICEDETASFTATSGLKSYKWSTGDTSATIVYAGTSSGMKTIWVLADSGLSSEATDTVYLMVHPTPAGPIIMDSANMNQLHVSNVAPGSTYQWYQDGTKMNSETDTILDYVYAGDYHVEVTDSNGCTNVSNTVSTTIYVGIAFDLRSSLSIYPNPSIGSINIQWAQGYSITVMNINGQIVQSIAEVQDNTMKIELASGMYFVKVQKDEESVITKIVIR